MDTWEERPEFPIHPKQPHGPPATETMAKAPPLPPHNLSGPICIRIGGEQLAKHIIFVGRVLTHSFTRASFPIFSPGPATVTNRLSRHLVYLE